MYDGKEKVQPDLKSNKQIAETMNSHMIQLGSKDHVVT